MEWENKKGVLHINKNNYNKYCNTNINVKCTILDEKKEGAFIESYSDDVSNWCDIYYDKKRNILVNTIPIAHITTISTHAIANAISDK